MILLHATAISSYSAKLRIVLRHKGLSWQEREPPGGYGSDAYRALVPQGTVPALEVEGLRLGDSEAAAEFLEERFPDPAMLPADIVGRARARELSRFHDTAFEPAVRALFPLVGGRAADREARARCAARLAARLEGLARLIAERRPPTPQHLLLCDCGYPVSFLLLRLLQPALDLDLRWPDAVVDWMTALETVPAVAVELARYETVLEGWLARGQD